MTISSNETPSTPSEKAHAAPDVDLTADDWELAKAAAMIVVSDGLDKPDDFLADIRARISSI